MLRINLFGPLRLCYHDQPVKFAALPKTLPLFAYLLLNRAKPIGRTTLACTFWPDHNEADARSNLRRHLYELRRVLPPAPDDCPWLLIDNSSVQWNPAAPYWCDVVAFLQASSNPGQLAEAIPLYTDDLLPELYEDWIFVEREGLRNRFFDTLSQLLSQARDRGDQTAALGYAQQILHFDPLREDVLRELMTLRYATGDRAGALQAYQRFVQRLREALDIAPMVETSALYDTLARQVTQPSPVTQPAEADKLPATPPPAIAVDPMPAEPAQATTPPHYLPAQLTSFIGRDAEVAALRHLLTRRTEPLRLLTLTGAGGSGKTRLALEVGARLLAIQPAPFAQGIYAVLLAAVTEPALVLSAIAATLGVKEQGTTPLIAALKSWLRDKQLLLILDNCEQVTHAAGLLVELLQAAPGLTLLVTSRKLLSIYGEHEFPVLPLALPEPEDWTHPERLAAAAAVTLFLTRSRAVNATFTLNRDNAAAVAEICVRLDGLPLALELAAARSKLFTPQALLPQLARSLDLLVGAQHGLAERQRTLRQTIDWSYQLLDQAAQQLFARLGVFVGEFTLAAVEALLSAEPNLVDGLLNLLNQSMIQRVEPADPTDVTLRFRLLLTLRDYALAQLTALGELTTLQAAHAHYYLGRVEQAASVAELAKEGYWLDQIAADLDNLRAAFAWAQGQADQHELLARLAIAASSFWLKRGYLAEGRGWLEQALAQQATVPTALQAKVNSAAGMLAWYQEDYAAAQRYLQQSLARWQQLGADADQDAMARIYLSLGGMARQHDNYHEAHQYHSAALAIQRTLNNQQGMADALHNLGVAEMFLGHYAAAQACFAECYALDCALGDQWGIFLDLNSWGVLDYVQGNYGAARARLEEGLTLARGLGARTRLSLLLSHLGKVALAEARWTDANRLFQEALTIGEEVGIKSQRFAAQLGLALLLLHRGNDWDNDRDNDRGNDQAALGYLTRNIAIWRADRKPKELLSLLDAFALLLARQGATIPTSAEKAAQLLGFAAALRTQKQLPPREPIYIPIYEQALALLHTRLTPADYAAAHEAGERLTLDELVLLLG